MKQINNSWEFNLAVRLFIIIAVITLLVAGQTFFIPFILAIFLTFLLYPISNRLEKFKVPKAVAIIISILVGMTVIAGLVYFFIDQLNSFRDDLPELKAQLNKKSERLVHSISNMTHIEPAKIESYVKGKVKESDDAGATIVVGIFSFTGSLLAMLGLMPLYIFFLTYFKEKYKNFIRLIVKDNPKETLSVIAKISTVSKNYLKGVFIDVLILSVLGSVGYMLLGLKHAILFGVLAALLNIIPYIGVLIGSLLPVMMAIITKDEIGYALGAIGVAVVVQFLDNNFISPYVVGSSVSINPLTAIIVLVIGALIWGIAGMVLSIPVAGVLKVVCDNFEQLKPYGYLIGEEVNYRERGFFRKRPVGLKKEN
jgi:predicted PurR-regulated permease PerM